MISVSGTTRCGISLKRLKSEELMCPVNGPTVTHTGTVDWWNEFVN